MAREMKISRNSIDIKVACHTTSNAGFEVFSNSSFLLLSIRSLFEWDSGRNTYLFDGISDINLMDLENVLDVQAQHRARIFRETNIYICLEFLIQVLLVDYEVTSLSGHAKAYRSHDY